MSVSYTCTEPFPGPVTIAEQNGDKSLQIKCPGQWPVFILAADYLNWSGYHAKTCSNSTVQCVEDGLLQSIKNHCDHKHNCTITTNGHNESKCSGKQLIVMYRCGAAHGEPVSRR